MFEGLFQPMHLIIILVISLIVFGPGKLPELGKGLGKSIREFKKAMADISHEGDVASDTEETPKEIASPVSMEISHQKSPDEITVSKQVVS